MKLSDFTTLSFDCYGTLIDWESGMIAGLAPLTSQLSTPLSRDQILEAHARAESTQQRWTPAMPYSELLSIVYKRLAEDWGLTAPPEACAAYGRSVKDWPAFPDSAEALAYLSQHFKLVILSNVDNASFAASNAKLGVAFDAIITAQDVGSYKPSDRNFEYMLEVLAGRGIEKSQILHTAESLFHDHVPAHRHGLTCAWIYRRHGQDGFGATMTPSHQPDIAFQFTSMAEMVRAHQAQI
ncbi:MAG: haloacid dehalogenase type II [Pseudomonadota bacterium]